jgi:hypothetical protein
VRLSHTSRFVSHARASSRLKHTPSRQHLDREGGQATEPCCQTPITFPLGRGTSLPADRPPDTVASQPPRPERRPSPTSHRPARRRRRQGPADTRSRHAGRRAALPSTSHDAVIGPKSPGRRSDDSPVNGSSSGRTKVARPRQTRRLADHARHGQTRTATRNPAWVGPPHVHGKEGVDAGLGKCFAGSNRAAKRPKRLRPTMGIASAQALKAA